MARRRYQKGSLYLRGETWFGRWLEDEVVGGEIIRRHRHQAIGTKAEFPTQKLARRELEHRLAEINSPTYRARPSCTFSEFAELWERTCLSSLKPSTAAGYRHHLHKYLIVAFGIVPLRQLDAQSVQRYLVTLNRSPRTMRNVLMTLLSLWRRAHKWGYVSSEWKDGVELPAAPHVDQRFFTLEETRRIILAASEPFKTMYWLAAETGLRRGEICALHLTDVDTVNRLVTVRQSVWHGKQGEPKSKRARRCAAISQQLSDHLAAFIAAQKPTPSWLLFHSKNDTPLDGGEIVKRKLKPLLKKLGIAHGGWHAFRHGLATEMDRQGVPLAVRSARLGHSDVRLTLDTYTHAVSSDERDFVGKVGGFLCQSLPTTTQGQDEPKLQTTLVQ